MNPFEQAASEATHARRKRMERDAKKEVRAPMVPRPAERAIRERSQQMVHFRKWKREIREGLLNGEYAPEITQLLRLVRKIPDPEVLVHFVATSAWLRNGHVVMRNACLEYIDSAISRWRVRHGLPTFDDGVPGEVTPFTQVRDMLWAVPDDTPSKHTSKNIERTHDAHPILNPQ